MGEFIADTTRDILRACARAALVGLVVAVTLLIVDGAAVHARLTCLASRTCETGIAAEIRRLPANADGARRALSLLTESVRGNPTAARSDALGTLDLAAHGASDGTAECVLRHAEMSAVAIEQSEAGRRLVVRFLDTVSAADVVEHPVIGRLPLPSETDVLEEAATTALQLNAAQGTELFALLSAGC